MTADTGRTGAEVAVAAVVCDTMADRIGVAVDELLAGETLRPDGTVRDPYGRGLVDGLRVAAGALRDAARDVVSEPERFGAEL